MSTSIKGLSVSPLYNVLLFSGFWALQIFIAKLGFLNGVMVLPFQLIMVLAAVVTLALVILPGTGRDLASLFRNHPSIFWQLFLANAIQAGLGTSLSIIGIALTDTINAGFLVKMGTVTTILFAWLILKENMSIMKVGVVFGMLLGAYLLTTAGQRMYPRVGDLLILAACFCWSLGNVLVRKILKTKSVRADVVTLQKPLASLPVFMILVVLSIYFPGVFGNLSNVLQCCFISMTSLPYAIASGICLALAWIFLYRTLHMATASYMTLMSMVTPIIVSFLALVFLNERLIWIQVLGAGLILFSGAATYISDIVFN